MDRIDHPWHVAINQHTSGKAGSPDYPRFMYDAKDAYLESTRLALLFKRERTDGLRKIHQQCSHSPVESIADNHLTCVLGVKCAACPHLKALEKAELEPEQIDTIKAWTCVTHILMNGGDEAREGYILTVDDRMFWDRTYANMAMSDPDDRRPVTESASKGE